MTRDRNVVEFRFNVQGGFAMIRRSRPIRER
jgi:hypothetical protein